MVGRDEGAGLGPLVQARSDADTVGSPAEFLDKPVVDR
jgi:hypothetical protein